MSFAVATSWRRLVRDLREGRKPPLVLLRQGLGKLRDERRVVARQQALGCRPLRKAAVGEVLSRLAGTPLAPPPRTVRLPLRPA